MQPRPIRFTLWRLSCIRHSDSLFMTAAPCPQLATTTLQHDSFWWVAGCSVLLRCEAQCRLMLHRDGKNRSGLRWKAPVRIKWRVHDSLKALIEGTQRLSWSDCVNRDGPEHIRALKIAKIQVKRKTPSLKIQGRFFCCTSRLDNLWCGLVLDLGLGFLVRALCFVDEAGCGRGTAVGRCNFVAWNLF